MLDVPIYGFLSNELEILNTESIHRHIISRIMNSFSKELDNNCTIANLFNLFIAVIIMDPKLAKNAGSTFEYLVGKL